MANLRRRVADWITGAQPDGYGGYGGRGWTSWGYGFRGAETNADPSNYAWWAGFQLTPVRGAVEYIARQVGACDVHLLALTGGRWERQPDTALPPWARTLQASTYQVRAEFLASLVTYALLGGNGFAVVTRYDGGQPARLAASSSAVTSVFLDGKHLGGPAVTGADLAAGNWAQGLAYSVGGRVLRPYDPDVMYADNAAPTVVHMRRPGSSTGVVGESPLTETAPSWRLGLAAEAHAELLFLTGGMSGGAFVDKTGKPNPAQVTAMKEAYANKRSDPLDRHMPSFMVGDWAWMSTMVSPEQLQLIDSRKLTWNSATTMFGVPLALLGAPGTEQVAALGQIKKVLPNSHCTHC